MPFFFKVDSKVTSVNTDLDVMKPSVTNGSTARKFVGFEEKAETVQQLEPVKSNLDMIVEAAAPIKDVAATVEVVAQLARNSIDIVRKSIENETPPEQKLEGLMSLKTSVEEKIESVAVPPAKFVEDIVSVIPTLVFRKKDEEVKLPAHNTLVPSLDRINVDIDKRGGATDAFYCELVFSIDEDLLKSGSLKAFRIFRSTVKNPIMKRGTGVLSAHAVDILKTNRPRFRSKCDDETSKMEVALREAGVANATSILNPVDPTTNLRLSTDDSSFNSVMTEKSFSKSAVGFSVSNSLMPDDQAEALDKSVAEDINTAKNLANSKPQFMGFNNLVKITQGKDVKNTGAIVDENNSQNFVEIAVISQDKLKSRVVGGMREFFFLDETASYGKTYRYYVTTIDTNMMESLRSKVVEVPIEIIRVPESPRRVYCLFCDRHVSLSIVTPDKLIDKFEIYKREADQSLIKGKKFLVRQISDNSGFNISHGITERAKNGFVKIGESLNSVAGGGLFIDRDVIPGRKYVYRVYSVDVFGNKSERPTEASMFVPDRGGRMNDLRTPLITSEVDSTSGKIRITMSCDDKRVKMLFLSRRDLTIGDVAFSVPASPSRNILGNKDVAHSSYLKGYAINGENKDVTWNGVFTNDPDRQTVFVDGLATLDRIYQYKVYGVDSLGQRTSDAISKPTMVLRRPMIDRPINLRAIVTEGPNFSIGGIKLDWMEGNVDVTAEDMLGNRETLQNTSVRTVYQVERRKVGDDKWYQFPIVDQPQFFDMSDSTAGKTNQRFRPPFVEENQTYLYRVKAIETGSFVSNYSGIVEIFASLPIKEPLNFRVYASDTRVTPFYVVLNWDTPGRSATVDRWEIERCVVNNVAADSINFRNPSELAKIQFQQFRTVYRESSRFKSSILDSEGPVQVVADGRIAPTVFTGEHHFQDANVSLGNTYFYRIRSVGVNGDVSTWVYRGMKLTNESFEKKVMDTIPREVMAELSLKKVPLMVSDETFMKKTDSISPEFSKPENLQFQSQTIMTEQASAPTVESKSMEITMTQLRSTLLKGR